MDFHIKLRDLLLNLCAALLYILYPLFLLQEHDVPDVGEYYHDHSFVKISDSFSTKGYGFGASSSQRFQRQRIASLAGPGRYETPSSLSTKSDIHLLPIYMI